MIISPREVALPQKTQVIVIEATDRIRAADLAERIEVLPDRLLLYTDEGDATLDAVRSRGKSPIAALVRRSTLEDVFLHLTGRSLVE